MYECRCCGISKHIHPEEDVNALAGDFELLLGDKIDENPVLEEKENVLDSSDALSDQVSSLNINVVEDGRDREVHF